VNLSLHINTRPLQACETCLPQTEQYVDDHEHSVIGQVSPENFDDYRSPMDWVLATFVPPLRADIMRYYADEGPMLKDQLPADAVKQIDMTILATLQQLEAAA
jgi:hypothetical protein